MQRNSAIASSAPAGGMTVSRRQMGSGDLVLLKHPRIFLLILSSPEIQEAAFRWHVIKLCILAHRFEKLTGCRNLRYAIWNLEMPSGFGDLRHSRRGPRS